MNEEYAFITEAGEDKVHELITVEELKDYQEKFNTGFHLTDKESEVMLGYMEGHDYVLGENQDKLYRGDLAEVVGMICWEEFSMDDVIDIVCEWNYELILEADALRNNSADIIDFSKMQSRYDSLKVEEIIMDKLFQQTKYAKEVEELARKLADEFIMNMNPGQKAIETKVLKDAIVSVNEQINQYGSRGRGR